MAHFRSTIQGTRGEASRLGTKASGMYASIDGWHIGVDVHIRHTEGRDVISISLTNGSQGGTLSHIGTYNIVNDILNKID